MNEKPVSPKIVLTVIGGVFSILAILAVNSFMKAQIRANVAAVESSFSTCRAVFETYRLDFDGRLPDAWKDGDWHATWQRFTTPVAYISGIPIDHFQPTFRINYINGHPYYEFVEAYRKQEGKNKEYAISSIGPDRDDDTVPFGDYPNTTLFVRYCSTNGLYSSGDIIFESEYGLNRQSN